jgi:hypothetical protein
LPARGIRYLDAPIPGSSQQTRDGEATVIVGGDRATFEACEDLWRALGRKVFHVGSCGSAARMTLISNLVFGLNRAVLAEGLAFAEALGVSPAAALEVLAGSNAYSRAMDLKGRKMVECDFAVQARLSQIARTWHITPESWRWVFTLAAAPAVLGLVVLAALPESPLWLAARRSRHEEARTPSADGNHSVILAAASRTSGSAFRELLHPPLLRLTIIGVLPGSIPMVGAWSASKWMIPWADKITSAVQPGYKAVTQGWWALGAVLGSFFGAQIAAWLGRRRACALISAGATALTLVMFLGTAPLRASFLPIVFAPGFVATLFFGWLSLYLPELFPTHVRAAGSGIAGNLGRFATAVGVFFAGVWFSIRSGSYPHVGSLCGLVYVLGIIVIWWAPETTNKPLQTA